MQSIDGRKNSGPICVQLIFKMNKLNLEFGIQSISLYYYVDHSIFLLKKNSPSFPLNWTFSFIFLISYYIISGSFILRLLGLIQLKPPFQLKSIEISSITRQNLCIDIHSQHIKLWPQELTRKKSENAGEVSKKAASFEIRTSKALKLEIEIEAWATKKEI